MPAQKKVEELTEYSVDEFEKAGDDNDSECHGDGNDESCKKFTFECNANWVKHSYYLLSTVTIETVKRS
jgi:hypothetical protein